MRRIDIGCRVVESNLASFHVSAAFLLSPFVPVCTQKSPFVPFCTHLYPTTSRQTSRRTPHSFPNLSPFPDGTHISPKNMRRFPGKIYSRPRLTAIDRVLLHFRCTKSVVPFRKSVVPFSDCCQTVLRLFISQHSTITPQSLHNHSTLTWPTTMERLRISALGRRKGGNSFSFSLTQSTQPSSPSQGISFFTRRPCSVSRT